MSPDDNREVVTGVGAAAASPPTGNSPPPASSPKEDETGSAATVEPFSDSRVPPPFAVAATTPADTRDWQRYLELFCKQIAPPIILIDMDNTIADWEGQFERLMRIHHPHVELQPPDRRTQFFIELNYPPEVRQCILSLTDLPDFWLGMNPVPGSIEAILAMDAMGLNVHLLTTPDVKHTSRCAREKIDWVQRHLGAAWRQRTILANDKTLVRGDILIDDRPGASVGLLKPSWTHLLFRQPYNLRSCDCPRLTSWSEWGPCLYEALRTRHLTRLTAYRLGLAMPEAREVREAWDPLLLRDPSSCVPASDTECCGSARLGSPLQMSPVLSRSSGPRRRR